MTYKTYLTPARNAFPRKMYSDSVYYGLEKETTEGETPPRFYAEYWSEIARESTEMEWHPIKLYDTHKADAERLSAFNNQTPEFNEALLQEIIQAFGVSAQELGIMSQAAVPGAQPWVTLTPHQLGWNPVEPSTTVDLPTGFEGWTESDFIDRREMYTLMEIGQQWSYAQCKWLENKMDQFESHDLKEMFPGGVHKWHFYARTHCPRYKAEQPRYIQERDKQDNAS